MLDEDRFWSQVDKSGGCWEWSGGRNTRGYGNFCIGRTVFGAHRFVWEQEYGPIPDGILVCHLCDNPPCVRPSHLFLGTQRDNIHDMIAKGRQVMYNNNPYRDSKTGRYAHA